MDFCAHKRNQFPVRIDMHVHMVGNGASGSGGCLRLKGWHRLLASYMLRQLGGESFRRIHKIANPIERDFQFKKALGFTDEVFTRTAELIRLVR